MRPAKRAIPIALLLGACLVGCATVPTAPSVGKQVSEERGSSAPPADAGAAQTEATPSPSSEPSAESKAGPAPEKDGSPRPPSGGKPEEKLSVGSVAGYVALGTLGVGLLEGMFYLYSYVLAGAPQSGWVFMALSPIAAGSGSGENAAAGVGFAGGVVALSLYNVIELRKSEYTHKERFQRNMVGFHVAMALGAGAQAIWGRKSPSTGSGIAVGMGVGDGGPALLIGGRF